MSPETLRRVGEGIAEKARETLSAMDVQDVTTRVVDGDPAGNIIAAAEHENAELVIMGRRGLGNVAGLVMGSVSHKVAHVAECACLTVKRRVTEARRRELPTHGRPPGGTVSHPHSWLRFRGSARQSRVYGRPR